MLSFCRAFCIVLNKPKMRSSYAKNLVTFLDIFTNDDSRQITLYTRKFENLILKERIILEI